MLRKVLLLLALTAVLAYAAATPPARALTCSPANQAAILAAIPSAAKAAGRRKTARWRSASARYPARSA